MHLGRLEYRADTIGKTKGEFTLPLPASVKGGRFQPYELLAFSAEAAAAPSFPSGSKIQASQRPAFYLYAPLPGAAIPSVYCGHGQDFTFTSNLEHTCFD